MSVPLVDMEVGGNYWIRCSLCDAKLLQQLSTVPQARFSPSER